MIIEVGDKDIEKGISVENILHDITKVQDKWTNQFLFLSKGMYLSHMI